MVPENLKYTKEHEWIKIENGTALIGISDYAQEELGDIVFVELPEKGAALTAGDTAVTLESVKAVSSVYAPFTGEVLDTNPDLEDEPELINSSPYENGWIYKMNVSDESSADLMTAAEYQQFIDNLD